MSAFCNARRRGTLQGAASHTCDKWIRRRAPPQSFTPYVKRACVVLGAAAHRVDRDAALALHVGAPEHGRHRVDERHPRNELDALAIRAIVDTREASRATPQAARAARKEITVKKKWS